MSAQDNLSQQQLGSYLRTEQDKAGQTYDTNMGVAANSL